MKADGGVNFAIWDTVSFELSVAMVLQFDLKTFHLRGNPVNLFHQPAGTLLLGLPIDGRGRSPYIAANIAALLLNFHLQHSGKDLVEIGLLQLGIGSQVDLQGGASKTQFQLGILTIEGHPTDKVSILLTFGFNSTINRDGLDTHPSPFLNIGIAPHGPYIDRKREGEK